MRTGNPGHLDPLNYIGLRRYFLTFCTDARHPGFAIADAVALVLEQFVRAAGDERMAILAYCFMPDHTHLLIEGECETSNALSVIKRSKQFSGCHYKQRFGRKLWQRYGFEHVLRDEEATLSVARYILENPIRGGLVKCVEDYAFVGSLKYSVKEILEAVQLKDWRRHRR